MQKGRAKFDVNCGVEDGTTETNRHYRVTAFGRLILSTFCRPFERGARHTVSVKVACGC